MPVCVSNNTHMLLNDGTFLYDAETVEQYLSSLGFDIDSLKETLFEEETEEKEHAEEMVEYYKKCAESDFEAANNMAIELENMIDQFRTKYKAKAVINVLDELESIIKNYTE